MSDATAAISRPNSRFSLILLATLIVVFLTSTATVVLAAPGELISIKQTSRVALKTIAQQSPNSKPGSVSVASPNPYLSFLPVEVVPDYTGWNAKLGAVSKQRRNALLRAAAASGLPRFLISQSESEPVGVKGVNDNVFTADAVPGFGTGAGDDPEADITGDLKGVGSAVGFSPVMEDDGDINKATVTPLVNDSAVTASGFIGDLPFGSPATTDLPPANSVEEDGSMTFANLTGLTTDSFYTADGEIGGAAAQASGGSGTGDFDLYRFDATESTRVLMTVTRRDSTFRPILGVYDGGGTLVAAFDDFFFEGEVFLDAELGGPGTWFIAVGGNLEFDGDQSNEFLGDFDNADSGPGFGSEGLYTLDLLAPSSGDFDFYTITAAVAGDTIDIEVDTDPYFGELDPIVGLFDDTGFLIAFNDDDPNPGTGEPFDSYLSVTIPLNGDYHVAVGGFTSFPTDPTSFPSDAFDSSTGPGFGGEGDYDLTIARNIQDIDMFSFELDAGDIIAANTLGSAQFILLFDPTPTLINGSFSDISGIYPASSALPGGGVASTAYIVGQTGTYYAGVTLGEGPYTLELRAFRAPQEAGQVRQKLFLDFDGATLDTTIYGPDGIAGATLSPLSAFLADWGLAPGDEDALIDAIVAEVEQALKTDIQANGLNSTFDIEILNSKDHADPFGAADVSRIIIGGTIAESGIDTIGIAESIDPGNYDQSETALVLLDLLSDPNTSNPNSLNSFPVVDGTIATKIALVAAGVGNVVSHEGGHYFSNFHTNNFNATANLMDTGGNLANLVGVGADGIFGTGDDVNVVFEADEYDPFEGFIGIEDTKNSIAYSLAAGPAQFEGIVAFDDISGNGMPEVGVAMPGSTRVHVRDGSTDALITDINFGADAALQMEVVADLNSSGNPEIAILNRQASGQVRVQIRDSLTGAVAKNLFYGLAYEPVAMDVVADYSGNGLPEIAVLGSDAVTDAVRVQVQDGLNGFLDNVFLGTQSIAADVVTVADTSGNSVPEIGILGVLKGSNQVRAQMWDADTAAFQTNVWFGNVYQPHTTITMPDVNSNGSDEIVAMGVDPATNNIRVQIRDSDTTATLYNVWLGSVNKAVDLALINDINNDGVADIAVLLETPGGTGRVRVQSGSNGAFIRNLFYAVIEDPIGLAVMSDYSGNGFDELAALGMSGGNRHVLILDTNTGGQVNRIDFP